MTDKEKVIKGLETCIKHIDRDCPIDCSYHEICTKYEGRVVFQPLLRDAFELLKEQEKRLKDPDRITVTRCKDCRYFEPSNAEEGDSSGHCRNDYAPCQNQTVDAWWFCGSAERVSE